ncbi:MAG: threonylcarbamoyl-AMP synthase [Magnetococcales bacterium]|nr:threonylcarbamoyl-AMP synthase [Magnetococcales bacterium]NGZ29345.1 threonylcarbamoyl-AMP synthase [Magnetococcales bacterium]
MGQNITIHPDNPQPRLLKQAATILEEGGVIVYPTDTTYGLGCALSNLKAVERIIHIKKLPANHQLSILCADLSEISRYARVDNQTYRWLKRHLPGPYTFVLEASREVPKTILPKRKTIGLRIPNHPICLGLLKELGQPILSTSLKLPGQDGILTDPEEIKQKMGDLVDLVIDGGPCPAIASTVVDLTGDIPEVLREGAGDPSVFTVREVE